MTAYAHEFYRPTGVLFSKFSVSLDMFTAIVQFTPPTLKKCGTADFIPGACTMDPAVVQDMTQQRYATNTTQ